MFSDIQQLELASGIKDSLINAGFLTIESILASSIADLSNKVGVDLYIAQIILQEAKKFGTGTNEQQTQLLISDRELTELN
jgi:small basic protein